jgi:kumamolisin
MFKAASILATLILTAFGAMAHAAFPATGIPAEQTPDGNQRLPGHQPVKALAQARALGRLGGARRVELAISLPLRDRQALEALVARIYDPADPLHGHYLTAAEFARRFGPSRDDYEAVADYFAARGMKVSRRHPNRLVLNLKGRARNAESILGLKLLRYRNPAGREFFAPDRDPELPARIAARILHVAGLDDAEARRSPRLVEKTAPASRSPLGIGSGPGGGLTPDDIATAYNLGGTQGDGSGQTLGVFSLAGYDPADIAFYQNYFGLTDIAVRNISVDGGIPRSQAVHSEATLDVELLMATAPRGSTLLVYEGPNTPPGFIDILNRIATDNLAKAVSCSWGSSEDANSDSYLQAENQIFLQMAAQGQTFFAAAGDGGAYDNGVTLSVDDPASQPYVMGVGGTRLSLDSGGAYLGETTWNGGRAGAGGGGVSKVWSIPSYQQGLLSAASRSRRNVPDVSLAADPDTGYSIYYRGAWTTFGGTSCAAPIWTGFAARVNQERLAQGYGPLGLLNPALYRLARSTRYPDDFHDTADGSNNLYYTAFVGYDNATGWGSFNGANLLADLSSNANPMSTDPAVRIVAPNGGETLAARVKFPVQWDSANLDPGQRLKLSFSRNGGRTWTRIKGRVGTSGTALWKPGIARITRQGLMRICLPKTQHTAALCDVSDGVFSIVKTP